MWTLYDQYAYVDPFNCLFRWRDHFDAKFFFLEQEDSNYGVVANFICQLVPDALSTCKYLQNKRSGVKERRDDVKNTSMRLEADRLATAAFKRGWLSQRAKQNGLFRHAFDEFSDVKEEEDRAIPLECALRKSLDTPLNCTLSFMHASMQGFNDDAKNTAFSNIKLKFASYEVKHKFCDMNIEAFVASYEREMKGVIKRESLTPTPSS